MDIAARIFAVIIARLRDPRYFQIGVLTILLVFGIVALDFGIHWQFALITVTTALAVQLIGTKLAGAGRFDPLSPLITSLSLTLLLRTDEPWICMAAAATAIGSKFLLRIRGKHIFNPANLAIVVWILASDRAWISTGQWGNATLIAFALVCFGYLVLSRARRAETTITFLIVFAALLLARAFWLGDPLSIPVHQLQSGALLIFAFFMISDPKTTPDSRLGRVFYAAIAAGVTYFIQFVLYEPGAAILALVCCAPLVPIIDAVTTGHRYEWTKPIPASRKRPAAYTAKLAEGVH